MAEDTNISMAVAKAALDAVVDMLDGGTGANPKIRIYNGTKPATPDATPTGTTLAEIDLGASTIFGNATTGTGTSSNSAVASAGVLPKSDPTANTTGTATWFRALNKSGTAIIDGTVGTSSADMILDSVSITGGQSVTINTWKIKMSRGS